MFLSIWALFYFKFNVGFNLIMFKFLVLLIWGLSVLEINCVVDGTMLLVGEMNILMFLKVGEMNISIRLCYNRLCFGFGSCNLFCLGRVV